MPTTGLAAFREKHPQYNDMSDAKLGEALRQKYYTHMPEEEYWDKIGVENPHPITTRGHEALEDVRQDFARPKTAKTWQEGALQGVREGADLMLPQVKALKTAGDIANVPLAAVGGAAEHGVSALQHHFGQPQQVKLPPWLQTVLSGTPAGPAIQQWNQWAANPALARRQVGDIAQAATPLPGVEALEGLSDTAKVNRIVKEYGVSRATAQGMLKAGLHDPGVAGVPFPKTRDAGQALHQERVGRLEKQGMAFTPGQRQGGLAKVTEDRMKTGSLTKGYGVHQARQEVLERFNRTALEKPLRAIKQALGKGDPIGHEGVTLVRDKLSDYYTKTLQGAVARQDTTYTSDMKKILAKARKLNADGQTLFANALSSEVTPRFSAKSGTPARTMSGQEFKDAESALKEEARKLQGAPDAFQRQAGKLIKEVAGALRDSVDRNSPAGVVGRLKNADLGWAMLKRIEAAAVSAADKDGVFNSKQFLNAITGEEKRGAGRAGKARVAKGQALLQDFARDAHGVLKNEIRDPGTAAQAKMGLAGRTVSGLLGGALGHLARHAIPLPNLGEIGAGLGVAMGGPVDRMINEAMNESTRLGLLSKMEGPRPLTRPSLGAVKAGAVTPAIALARQREREQQGNPKKPSKSVGEK